MCGSHLRSVRRTCDFIESVLAVTIIFAANRSTAGGSLLFDDFERFTTSGGDLTFSDDHARTAFTQVGPFNDLANTSIRTQLRVTQGSAGGIIRWDARQPAPNGYFGLILPDGTARLGWADGDWPVLREVATGLDAAREDVVLQLEAIGNTISLWAWAAGQPMPIMPTVSITDDTVVSGSVALGGLPRDYPGRGPIESVFRFVQVADMHVPEPAAAATLVSAFAAVYLCCNRAAFIARRGRPVADRPAACRRLG
jgi:hypothetical protein